MMLMIQRSDVTRPLFTWNDAVVLLTPLSSTEENASVCTNNKYILWTRVMLQSVSLSTAGRWMEFPWLFQQMLLPKLSSVGFYAQPTLLSGAYTELLQLLGFLVAFQVLDSVILMYAFQLRIVYDLSYKSGENHPSSPCFYQLVWCYSSCSWCICICTWVWCLIRGSWFPVAPDKV